MIGMAVVLYYLNQTFVELQLIESKFLIALLFGFILLMGIFISWISTYFATQRFLNLRTDELYY